MADVNTILQGAGRSPVAAAPTTVTRHEAVRFLHRASFGGTVADVARVQREGVDAWITREMSENSGDTLAGLQQRDGQLDASIWKRYLTGDQQLRKRIGYALSQIFVVSQDGLEAEAVAEFSDHLERGAFGTFRSLLEVVTRSFAMGQYLTYAWSMKANASTGQQPDENYAREILQLFSIGLIELNQDGSPRLDARGGKIDTYGQDDVTGLARVFTGWAPDTGRFERPELLRRPMVNTADWHERGAKRFLGRTIPAGTGGEDSLRIALDTIAAHRNVAPFICRQLIQRLVTSNPSRAYVERVADVFTNDGSGLRGNLGAVVRAILTDDEAWAAPSATSGKLREPVLRFSIVMRALGIKRPSGAWNIWSTGDPATELGQAPYHSPSVFNFYRPGYVPPRSPLGDRGLVAPEFQIANETSVIGWVNFLADFLLQTWRGTEYQISDLMALVDDPPALVAELGSRLTGGRLGTATADLVVRTVRNTTLYDADRQRIERVHVAVLLIAASTDFLYER